jgi:pSer/pThr/pTyr-binding forkhead associated (FHA) protein
MGDKEAYCPKCGTFMLPLSKETQALGNIELNDDVMRLGTSHFGTRTNLVIQVREYSKTFILDAGDITELVIGRYDPDTGESPDIDLQECDAVNKGVSRRHAVIVKQNDKLLLIDKGSPNGTFLNGQRQIANQTRVLRDGDEVRLGHLVLVFSFEKVSPLSIGNV